MPVSEREPRSLPPTNRLVTAEEFGDHPEWGPCELIRGKVVQLSNPKPIHGLLMLLIGARILDFVNKRKLGKVFCGDVGIVLSSDPDTVRGPDICFIQASRLPATKMLQSYLAVAPDLCVEIVSPTDRKTDISEKVDAFLNKGVALVWVIDPKNRNAIVYRKDRTVLTLSENNSLDGEDVLPGFQLSLTDAFSVLDE